MAKRRFSPNRIDFTNQQNQIFPVEDLKFKNPAAVGYDEFADTQRYWNMHRDSHLVGTVEIESSIEYAREAFHEKMEDFQTLDEDERLATMMEALLYRQMLRWNEDSKDTVLEGEKKEFMNSLNVFLQRRLDPDMQNEILQETEVDVAQNYTPDKLDLSLRELVQQNKQEVTGFGNWISKTAQHLNHKFDQRNNPHYNRSLGKVIVPAPKLIY